MNQHELIVYGLIGTFAALTAISVTNTRLILPRWHNGEIALGFVGRVIVSIAAAWAWDHDLVQAFIASLIVGVATSQIRTLSHVVRGNVMDNSREAELLTLRHKLAIVQQSAAFFGAGETPIHLTLSIEEAKKKIHELEQSRESVD